MLSHIPGTFKNNMQYDEQVAMTRGLRDRDAVNFGVILNLTKKTVVKNRFAPDQRNFEKLLVQFDKGRMLSLLFSLSQLKLINVIHYRHVLNFLFSEETKYEPQFHHFENLE